MNAKKLEWRNFTIGWISLLIQQTLCFVEPTYVNVSCGEGKTASMASLCICQEGDRFTRITMMDVMHSHLFDHGLLVMMIDDGCG